MKISSFTYVPMSTPSFDVKWVVIILENDYVGFTIRKEGLESKDSIRTKEKDLLHSRLSL